jgi:hypothetical protein
MASSKIAERVRYHKSTAGTIIPRTRPCPVADSLFANIPAAARALVFAAHRSADKSVFVAGPEHARPAALSESAGYLAPIGASETRFRITAKGEAWLAARMRAD